MKISEIFELNRKQNELDFVDIDVNKDMPLFLEPYFLSTREDPWSRKASRTLSSFLQHIIMLFRNGEKEKARDLFRFGEPYETCLGLSKNGVQGNGVGDEDATKLFEYIIESGILEDEVLSNISDIKIFVDNISHDKISDLCTNVIRMHLIEYTQNQCEILRIPMEEGIATQEYWNPKTLRWEVGFEKMLVVNQKNILLVPKSIVCRKKGFVYDSAYYARHFVLNFLVSQEKRNRTELTYIHRFRKGKEELRVKKYEVAKKYGAYRKGFLQDFTRRHPDYFERFKSTAKYQLSSLSNEEIIENHSDEFYQDIIDRLILEFEEIKPGRKDANKFHDHIIACMNFLFYPKLINPTKEKEINKGRKRIDLVYDNAAETGFFYNLWSVKDIPCSYIFVECKNYSEDVVNPEFDQLNGRFSIQTSKAGFLVFRTCDDEERLLDRCNDYYKQSKSLILPLQDKNFIDVLKKMKEDPGQRTNTIAENMLRNLTEAIILL